MEKGNQSTKIKNEEITHNSEKEKPLSDSKEEEKKSIKNNELLPQNKSHQGEEKKGNIDNKKNKESLKQIDHSDQMLHQNMLDRNNTQEKDKASLGKNEDDDPVARTVTVVEQENAIKSQILKKKEAVPSSSGSNRESEEKIKLKDRAPSRQDVSEQSKRLTPNSSLKESTKEEGIHDFIFQPNSPEDQSSNLKNSVKFKEDQEEYGEDEGSILPAGQQNSANNSVKNNQGDSKENLKKNSNSKITPILKNSNKEKNSDIQKEISVRMSMNKNEDPDKDKLCEKEPSNSDASANKKIDKNEKRSIIPNMVVEEDQINLSDLGNGPEKPTIKTIVKKMVSKKKLALETPEGKKLKVYLKSPDSINSKSTTKKTPLSSKNMKSPKSPNDPQTQSPSDDISCNGENSSGQEYKPLSDLIVYQDLAKHKNFTLKKYEDAIYRGMVDPKTQLRQGIGIMEYSTGRVYEGAWRNDLREGPGYEKYANNNIYKGHFHKGKAHGQGYYKWANGEYYDGEWNQGQKHGYGEWKSHDGDSYQGEWKEGKADGQGVYAWKNGDKYDGDWLTCLKHGKGTDYFANGDSYTGQYKYGKPWGTGVYIWKNGSTYKGQFKNGLKHGRGKWTKGEGEDMCIFEGNYIKGKKEGYGEFKWASGNFYRGEYKEDERHGYGEMYWVDDSFYKGAWEGGIQHGQGLMQLADGTIKKGMFENNVFAEEIIEAEESDDSLCTEDHSGHPNRNKSKILKKKKGKKRKKVKKLLLPNIDTRNTFADQSGRQYTSAKKPLMRNLSEIDLQTKRFRKTSNQKEKNSLSLPRINSGQNDSALSSRLKGFTTIAKHQAKERRKLETYFKSLDKAVQILRDKRQNELASKPWIPAGPVHQYQYRPSSKYG
ncbi:unnamed protein product [Moneuplotes crassus]|uniref:Uncharacterized protein n=3 Tax=Euplotes crassus TaxID=5936 RepID=A0AAD2D995_EUPCR|nr:unnamed protein product [Moneuplotes crassus]